MKIMKKALALFIALIMVLGVVPAYAADNDVAVDLIRYFTTDEEGASPIATTGNPGDVVVNEGGTFYLHLKFANNPTELPVTICDMTVLVGYDSSIVQPSQDESYAMDVGVQLKTAWNGTNVIIGAWADPGGIAVRNKILAEGTVYLVKFTALKDLTEDEIAKIKELDTASSVDGDGKTVTQNTLLKDKNTDLFTINWSSNLQEKEYDPPITIDASHFDVNLDDKVWENASIEPAVTPLIDGFEKGVNYDVEYGDNKDVGEDKGTITISLIPGDDGYVWIGEQRYEGGPIELTFNIIEKGLTEADFDWSEVVDVTYDGNEHRPGVTPADGSSVTADNYEVTYDGDTKNVGTVTVKVTGKTPYKNTLTKTFKINAKDITMDDIDWSDVAESYDWEGQAITPTIKAAEGSLVTEEDFTVTITGNKSAGSTATITVKGTRNFKGTLTKTFLIKAEQLTPSGTIELGIGFTSTNDDATSYDPDAKITKVNAGDKFVMWVNFGNNGVEKLSDTITAYDLLLEYDAQKIEILTCSDALTNPTINTEFNDNTIMASWAGNKGITKGMPAKLQKEGTLFVVVAKANETLDAAALKDVIGYVTSATNADIGEQVTGFYKLGRQPYNITEVETLFEISNSKVVVNELNEVFTYTGEKIEPKVTLYGITKDQFEIVYSNNVNVTTAESKAVATVTGKGNYYGSFEVKFEIVPQSIEGKKYFKLEDDVIEYTGGEIKPAIISDLVETTDYTAVYTQNVNVSTETVKGTVTITGKGNYTGTDVLYFDIVSKELKDAFFTISKEEAVKEYTGSDIEVAYTATGVTLNKDFVVEYQNNKEVGTATIIFKPAEGSNYVGTVTKTFEIVAQDIAGKGYFVIDDATYTGTAIIPVKGDTLTTDLVEGKDYIVVYSDNVNASTADNKAKATFTGIGNYTGKDVVEFTIKPVTEINVDEAFTITGNTDVVYTGLPIEPIVSSSELVEGRDYEVRYENHINASTETEKAKIIITGKGNYNFEKPIEFVIAQKPITADDFTLAQTQMVYDGTQLQPVVISKLVKDTDFEVRYGTNKDAGTTGTVTITGKGNYKGEEEFTFDIVAKAITEADFRFDLSNQTYTGAAIIPTVTPLTNLVEGVDYEVTGLNNINVGAATVAVAGKGNYTGSIAHIFTIVPKLITADDLAVSIDTSAANRWFDAELEDDKEILDAGVTVDVVKPDNLTEGRDYEVIYTNNNAAGIATVTVKGIGNYAGTISDTFVIKTFRLGDVDNDTTWSTLDAVRILKMATGLYIEPTELEKMAANVVGDGKYNAVDALEVLKYSALIDGRISQYYGKVFGPAADEEAGEEVVEG